MARYLTVEQAADKLGCHPETIRRAIKRRELLATWEPLSVGPRYQIAVEDLAAFVEKRRRGLPDTPGTVPGV